MPKSAVSPTVRAVESWAEVRAHDQVIRYRRAGAGRAVLLLLCSPDEEETLRPELLDALGAGFRLIVPEPPADDADVAGWLASFLEGLGMSNVAILAVGRFCIPVLELAFFGLDQIRRIVLMLEGKGTRGEGRGALETAMREAAVPLLVVRRGQFGDDMVPSVTGFLRGEETAAPA